MPLISAISYLRVSTNKQGIRGLGIEAQRAAVATYADTQGLRVIEEVTEVESGAKADRPELRRALALCRRRKAVLVIAKLDRLSRNVAFLAQLLDGNGCEIAVADLPGADRFVLHVMAAVAEKERQLISERTSAAMQAKKRRGARFGSPTPEIGSKAGVRALRRQANDYARNVAPLIAAIRRDSRGISATGVARELDARGVPTARGGIWGAGAVLNVEKRVKRLRG